MLDTLSVFSMQDKRYTMIRNLGNDDGAIAPILPFKKSSIELESISEVDKEEVIDLSTSQGIAIKKFVTPRQPSARFQSAHMLLDTRKQLNNGDGNRRLFTPKSLSADENDSSDDSNDTSISSHLTEIYKNKQTNKSKQNIISKPPIVIDQGGSAHLLRDLILEVKQLKSNLFKAEQESFAIKSFIDEELPSLLQRIVTKGNWFWARVNHRKGAYIYESLPIKNSEVLPKRAIIADQKWIRCSYPRVEMADEKGRSCIWYKVYSINNTTGIITEYWIKAVDQETKIDYLSDYKFKAPDSTRESKLSTVDQNSPSSTDLLKDGIDRNKE